VTDFPDLGSGLLDVALRTSVVYMFLIVALRLAGRREVGQLSILDLVVVLIIANSVQNAMVGQNTTLLGGIVSALTLIILDRVLRTVLGRSRRIMRAIEGEPIVVVSRGQILEAGMRRAALSRGDLDEALRAHGVAAVQDVRLAVAETDGSISVIPRVTSQPPGGLTGID